MNNERPILLIDDDEHTKILVEHFVEDLPVEVTYISNAYDAFEKLTEKMFELIILDLSMPYMTGMEFLKRLRNKQIYDDIPVLVLTSRSDKTTVIKLAQLKVEGYLVKPPSKEDFITKITKILVLD